MMEVPKVANFRVRFDLCILVSLVGCFFTVKFTTLVFDNSTKKCRKKNVFELLTSEKL